MFIGNDLQVFIRPRRGRTYPIPVAINIKSLRDKMQPHHWIEGKVIPMLTISYNPGGMTEL